MVPEPPSKVAYRTLLVGVADYVGCNNDLSAPPYAVDDMFELLSRGYDFTLMETLIDKEATKENILNGVFSTFAESDNGDVSYFYFAGHGGMRYGNFYLCPADTDWTTAGNITVAELEYLLGGVAGTKVVILDCCHSGGFIGKSIPELLNKEGYQVLTSCMGEQFSHQMGGTSFSEPYMVFTQGILEGCSDGVLSYLADINNDRVITMTEVYNFAVIWVANHLNVEQDAQMYPRESDFPIIEY